MIDRGQCKRLMILKNCLKIEVFEHVIDERLINIMTQLNIVTNEEKKSTDLTETYQLKSFPMCNDTGNDLMKIDDFLKIPTFPANRDVESRAIKAVTRLTTAMHKHVEVDLLHYTGPTTKKPAFFQHGSTYVLDGNTRQHIWRKHYSDKQVISTKTLTIPVPENVLVRTYDIDDAEEACKLYNIIDSVDAVETKAHKITGAFRAKNLLGTFKNVKIKRGQIGTALNIAVPYGGKIGYCAPHVTDLFDQVEKVRDALVGMDKLDAPGKGHFHINPATGMALLAGMAMDCDDTWLDAVNKLATTNVKELINDGNTLEGYENTATNALIKGNICNPLVPMVHNALPYDIGYGQNPGVVLDYLAYCWRCIIDHVDPAETITKDIILNSYMDLLREVWPLNA